MNIKRKILSISKKFFERITFQSDKLVIDIELTNVCNASCVFCPRDKTPRTGKMTPDVFNEIIKRINEKKSNFPIVNICGLGEPLLHSNAVSYIDQLTQNNIYTVLTTNGSLLSHEVSGELIDAGLKELHFSMSGIDETYEKIHKLNYERARKNLSQFITAARRTSPRFPTFIMTDSNGNEFNIFDFIPRKAKYTRVAVQITSCNENVDRIDDIKKFWKGEGIKNYFLLKCNNRAGALATYPYLKNTKFRQEALEVLEKNKINPLCSVPFMSEFIGWDGQYYMCCMDYRKELPLGSVFEYSIDQIDEKKRRLLTGDLPLCRDCSASKLNVIRDVLFDIESGIVRQNMLAEVIAILKE